MPGHNKPIMATNKKAKLLALALFKSDFHIFTRKGRTASGEYTLDIVIPDGGKIISLVSDHSAQDCQVQYHLLKQEARRYAEQQGWVGLMVEEKAVI